MQVIWCLQPEPQILPFETVSLGYLHSILLENFLFFCPEVEGSS